MLEVFEPGALNCYTFFRPTPLTLSVSRKPILTHFPLFGFLDFLLCVLIAPTPRLAFSLVTPRTLAAASLFSSGRAYPFSELSTSSRSSLDPYSDYVEVNISLSNSSSLLFLNVCAPPIRSSPSVGRIDSFFPSIFLSFRNFFILGDFNRHHPFEVQEVLPTPVGRKYSTGSSRLTFSFSMTLTYLLFYIAPLAVDSPLKFLLLPLLSPFFVPGRCFRTWVQITYQLFYISLSGISPQ